MFLSFNSKECTVLKYFKINFKRSVNYTFSSSDYKYAFKLYQGKFNRTCYNYNFKYVLRVCSGRARPCLSCLMLSTSAAQAQATFLK